MRRRGASGRGSGDCLAPASVQIHVDGALAVQYAASDDAASVPKSVCIDESRFGDSAGAPASCP